MKLSVYWSIFYFYLNHGRIATKRELTKGLFFNWVSIVKQLLWFWFLLSWRLIAKWLVWFLIENCFSHSITCSLKICFHFWNYIIVKINSQNFNRCPYFMRKVSLSKRMSTNSKHFRFIIVDQKCLLRKFFAWIRNTALCMLLLMSRQSWDKSNPFYLFWSFLVWFCLTETVIIRVVIGLKADKFKTQADAILHMSRIEC